MTPSMLPSDRHRSSHSSVRCQGPLKSTIERLSIPRLMNGLVHPQSAPTKRNDARVGTTDAISAMDGRDAEEVKKMVGEELTKPNCPVFCTLKIFLYVSHYYIILELYIIIKLISKLFNLKLS